MAAARTAGSLRRRCGVLDGNALFSTMRTRVGRRSSLMAMSAPTEFLLL
jgi:hypothetical protein